MAFDDKTRRLLANMVAECRRALTADVEAQLQARYGLYPDGRRVAVATTPGERQAADELADLWAHFEASEATARGRRKQVAYERLVREIGFTLLNRLAALRLCEERGLLVECVKQGMQSAGFRLYESLAKGALGSRYQTYRAFLEGVFDELAVDLGVLFAHDTPHSHIFPGEQALETVLAQLTAPELEQRAIWQQDETIGWIYQYYNDPNERKAMRKASNAPRNSRELAVRNQFFTPRYVVEFLTDNTLGRIWYEMRQGKTRLADECRYLVQRPQELFLAQGVEPPVGTTGSDALADAPHYVPFRPLKDPRDLKILDPAGGSGHFSLYAFDLLTTIYVEAWELGEAIPPSGETGRTLRANYPTRATLDRAVPALILRHNLHSIDIDPRATQIGALALWLRAQRHYQTLGLKPAERPPITRTNFVTAEPMPGDAAQLEAFIAGLEPKVLGHLVRTVFDKMALAGEAGSLLKIEEELREAIEAAREAFNAERLRQRQQTGYLPGLAPERPPSLYDFADMAQPETFWPQAERLVLMALRDYAEQAGSQDSGRRRLFAEDAARGFAFIDLCRQNYEIVLMNPPFGSSATKAKSYVDSLYRSSKSDLGIAFVMRGWSVSSGDGVLGAITSRSFVGNDGLKDWRESVLLQGNHLRTFADLGYGVLDDAMVEAAAYTLSRRDLNSEAFFIRVLDETDKSSAMVNFFERGNQGRRTLISWRDLTSFKQIPGSVLAYWLPARPVEQIIKSGSLLDNGGIAKHGLQTTNDFRFLRLVWEVPIQGVGESLRWVLFAKGGEYQPLWDDLHLCINWAHDGQELKVYVADKAFGTQGSGGWSRWINSWDSYFQPGLTFPERTTSDFSPRILPAGCIFSATGEAIFFSGKKEALTYLIGAYSRQFKLIVDAFVGSGDSSVSGSAANHYRSGLINSLPIPSGTFAGISEKEVINSINAVRKEVAQDETSRDFCTFPLLGQDTLFELSLNYSANNIQNTLRIIGLSARVEAEIETQFQIGMSEDDLIDVIIGPHPNSYTQGVQTQIAKEELIDLWTSSESRIISVVKARHGARRQITKKSYFANRRLELLSHLYSVHPEWIARFLEETKVLGTESILMITGRLLSFTIGCILGRWDIRYATGDRPIPELPDDPFAALPPCPPGMLTGKDGLLLTASPPDYPLTIAWYGILVDDPGLDGNSLHPSDIVRRVRDVLVLLWPTHFGAIEAEACEILGVKELRDYFRQPRYFFAEHLKRYSKSRRQAPIYWPLSTPSGSYTVWLYYHRLNEETLYTVVNQYVEPKIRQVEHRHSQLEGDLSSIMGRAATDVRDEIDRLKSFAAELHAFRAELLRVAQLPYKPNLNDGVIINAAPLHKLFGLRRWQKDTAEVWRKLEHGDYDWAHLAYTIWPDRVRAACRRDRSIAIAHDLEELCEVPPPATRAGRAVMADQLTLGLDAEAAEEDDQAMDDEPDDE